MSAEKFTPADPDGPCQKCGADALDTGCDMKINDEGTSNAAYWYERAMKAEVRLQKVMARCADLLDEDQFNELDAIAKATDSASVRRCDTPGCDHWERHGRACETCGTSTVEPNP